MIQDESELDIGFDPFEFENEPDGNIDLSAGALSNEMIREMFKGELLDIETTSDRTPTLTTPKVSLEKDSTLLVTIRETLQISANFPPTVVTYSEKPTPKVDLIKEALLACFGTADTKLTDAYLQSSLLIVQNRLMSLKILSSSIVSEKNNTIRVTLNGPYVVYDIQQCSYFSIELLRSMHSKKSSVISNKILINNEEFSENILFMNAPIILRDTPVHRVLPLAHNSKDIRDGLLNYFYNPKTKEQTIFSFLNSFKEQLTAILLPTAGSSIAPKTAIIVLNNPFCIFCASCAQETWDILHSIETRDLNISRKISIVKQFNLNLFFTPLSQTPNTTASPEKNIVIGTKQPSEAQASPRFLKKKRINSNYLFQPVMPSNAHSGGDLPENYQDTPSIMNG